MLKRNPPLESFACLLGRSRRRLQVSGLLLLLVSPFGWVRTSHAQATATADRTGQFNVFGAYSLVSPDYSNQKDHGFSVGGDFLLRKLIFGQPAIAVRYSKVTGPVVNESFFGGGLESYYKIGFVRPYATVLYGVGGLDVHIRGGNYSDSGNTLHLGGGVDVPVSRKFSARAEFLYGFLDISGKNGGPQGAINLNPTTINLGIVYHIR
jgi:hypothetical protein